MPWIEEDQHGDEDLPPIFQVLSLNSRALEDVKRLNETLAFGGSALTRTQEEAIATVVSAANQCRYADIVRAFGEETPTRLFLAALRTLRAIGAADLRRKQAALHALQSLLKRPRGRPRKHPHPSSKDAKVGRST